MRFTMPAAVLNPALAGLAQVAQRVGSSLPVLSGVLAEVELDFVRLTAYNLAVALEVTLPRPTEESYEPGARVLGVAILRDLLKHVTGEVTVECQDNAALVTYQGGQARLGATPAADFPRPAFVRPVVSLSTEALRQGIDRTGYAADRHTLTTAISGVRIQLAPGSVGLFATDTHRVSSFAAPVDADAEAIVVVPGEVLSMVGHLCDSKEVSLGWDEHGFTAAWQNARLFSRIPDGSYPNVEARIPTDYAVTAKVSRAALRETIGRAGVTADQYIGLQVAPGSVTVTSEGQAGGVREVLTAEADGEMTIYFDPSLIGDALSHLPGETVTVELNDPEGPARLRADDRGYAVVMPILPAAVPAAREEAKAS